MKGKAPGLIIIKVIDILLQLFRSIYIPEQSLTSFLHLKKSHVKSRIVIYCSML